jgi:hypothetical protein
LEQLGDVEARDPRTSALKFMYAMPEMEGGKGMPERVPVSNINREDDDEHVLKFRAKLSGEMTVSNTTPVELQISQERNVAGVKAEGSKSSYGKAKNQAEMEERHPRLKNAPVEGAFAKDAHVRHKPFSDVIRDVQCLRCQNWGHRSGDRECPLFNHNPIDASRQQREDPLTYMHQGIQMDRNHIVLKEKYGIALQDHDRLLVEDGMYVQYVVCTFILSRGNSYIDCFSSDIEEEALFLSHLSTKEKKKLLKEIQVRILYTSILFT